MTSTPDRRVVESPCAWCGQTIQHTRRGGQVRKYCSQGCRQRAYELRTVETRLGRDLAAGAVRATPVERVVEVTRDGPARQVVTVPTGYAWIPTLQHLQAQLADGTIPPAVAAHLIGQLLVAVSAAEGLVARHQAARAAPAATDSPVDPYAATPPPTGAVGGNRAARRAAKRRTGR